MHWLTRVCWHKQVLNWCFMERLQKEVSEWTRMDG